MFIKKGFGNAFLQLDAVVEYIYLTSTGVGDLDIPGQTRSIVYDPDIKRSGKFKASEFIEGEMGEVTAPFTRPLDTVVNYLLELTCATNARLNWACRGDRNIVWNYELAVVLLTAAFEGGSIGQPAITQPGENDRVQTGANLKPLQWSFVYLLASNQQTVAGAAIVHDIVFLPEECGDRCGPRVLKGCEGYAGRGSLGYLLGDSVIYTENCGAAWPITVADPFQGSKGVLAMLTAETAMGHRLIVGGGAEAGQPAEISYSDDGGITWNDVTVGAVNGQAINALCRDDLGRIWAAASDGYIYVSTNLGLTWAASYGAVDTNEDLRGIVFVGQQVGMAVGNDNVVMYTPNGGATWELLVGPAVGVNLSSIDVNRASHLYVSAMDGTIHRTIDYGTNWVEVLDMGSGNVRRLRFEEDMQYFGGAVWNADTGEGTFLRTEDGGVSWMAWATPANTGLRSLYLVDPNMIYICGDNGFIAKFDIAPGE